ncbi:hypothetical protein BJV82DRAFT_670888 [Fennellomyces sp. T-0311]|nr:hypothetical protein BJV82DRAFT_670888 [Fennellomyces sp. T-0311]
MWCPKPDALGVRFEGSLRQAYLALQACNAFIADGDRKPRVVWVILHLEGPNMLPAVAALRDGLQGHLSRDMFVKDDALHISAACVRLEARNQWEVLIENVREIAEQLNEALRVEPMIGHLSRLGSCEPRYISVRPTTDYDPIYTIVYTIRQLLSSKYGYKLRKISPPHMTLFSSQKRVRGLADFNASTLENLGLSWNLGSVQVSKIQVSQLVPSLTGNKYSILASYPILSPQQPL